MKLLLANVENNRERWLDLRRSTVGASEMPTICGLNPYKSVLELWAEKTGKIEPFAGNDSTWLGSKLEPVIAEFFERKNPGLQVQRCGALYAHDSIEGITATPDFWLVKPPLDNSAPWNESPERVELSDVGLLETKNAGYRKLDEWEENAPRSHQVQLQMQMGICGIQWGYVAGLIGGDAYEFKAYPFEFSPEVFEQCVSLAHEFLKFVREDIPPAAGPGDKKLVEKIVGEREKGKSTALPIDSYPVVREYLRIAKLRKALEAQAKEHKASEDALAARILQLMGDAERAETPWGISFKATTVKVGPKVVDGYSFVRLYDKGEFVEDDDE